MVLAFAIALAGKFWIAHFTCSDLSAWLALVAKFTEASTSVSFAAFQNSCPANLEHGLIIDVSCLGFTFTTMAFSLAFISAGSLLRAERSSLLCFFAIAAGSILLAQIINAARVNSAVSVATRMQWMLNSMDHTQLGIFYFLPGTLLIFLIQRKVSALIEENIARKTNFISESANIENCI